MLARGRELASAARFPATLLEGVWRCVTALAWRCAVRLASSAAGSVSIASVVAELVCELGGEARDRVGAVRVGGRVLGARVVGVAGGVEVVGLAAAAERGVAELAGEPGAGEHEGVIDGEALRDVDGDRVAVQQRRVAVDGAVVEEAGVERDRVAAAARA